MKIETKDNEMPWIKYDAYRWWGGKYRKKEYINVIRIVDGVLEVEPNQFWSLRQRGGIFRNGEKFFLWDFGSWQVRPFGGY